jgi:hypothetical protein
MNMPGSIAGNWQFRLKEGQLCPQDAEHLAYLSKLSDRNILPCCDLDCISLECAAEPEDPNCLDEDLTCLEEAAT